MDQNDGMVESFVEQKPKFLSFIVTLVGLYVWSKLRYLREVARRAGALKWDGGKV